MKFLSLIIQLSLFILPIFSFGQGSFDLWVVETSGKGGSFSINPETAYALTDRPEYDNQPSFINEYQLVFSAADESGNFDIIVYNFEAKKFTNLTKTSDRNENSPRITDCGMYIAAVVSEPDKKQRLWLYPTSFEPAELLYDDIEPVGYYDWYDNKAAMFILGDPNKLVYSKGRDNLVEIDTEIARSINRRPKTSAITYLSTRETKSEQGQQAYQLKSYDIESGTRTDLGYGLGASQDFLWLDKNHLLMAQGNTIFTRKYSDENWKPIGRINSETHQNISRVAYSADLNVLVMAIERKE
jgi:Tol biopolymer transport system component